MAFVAPRQGGSLRIGLPLVGITAALILIGWAISGARRPTSTVLLRQEGAPTKEYNAGQHDAEGAVQLAEQQDAGESVEPSKPSGQQGTGEAVRVLLDGREWTRQSQVKLQEWRSTLFGRIAAFYSSEEKKASDGGNMPIGRIEPEGLIRYNPFSPFLTCDGVDLVKLGTNADGGKFVCMHEELTKPGCVVYSLGSSGNFDFEEAVLQETPCEVFTFDCTYDGRSLDNDKRHHYHKICLGKATNLKDLKKGTGQEFMSYEQITTMLNHPRVDLLKIDIEGSEYDVFSEFKPACNLPNQIAMEVHFTWLFEEGPKSDPHDFNHLYWIKHNVSLGELGVFFLHLADLGYGVVSREDNMYLGGFCCSEFVLLRVEKPAGCP